MNYWELKNRELRLFVWDVVREGVPGGPAAVLSLYVPQNDLTA